MAKLIELTGPPGVGKSTYYSALVERWKKSSRWIPSEMLYPRQRIRYKDPKEFLKTVLQRLANDFDNRAFNRAGHRFVDSNPDYVNAVWNDINQHKHSINGKDLRFQDAMFLLESFQRIQVLLESPCQKPALKAEGIVHRLPHSIYRDNFMEEEEKIRELISKIHLPSAVIYLTCNPQENARRLSNRKYTWEGHRDMNETQLMDYSIRSHKKRDMIIDVLREHGTPVLTIDTTNDLEQNLKVILHYLDSHDYSRPFVRSPQFAF